MKCLRLVAVSVFSFALGAALFHTPTVKAQGTIGVQIVTPGMGDQRITGTPIGISCLGNNANVTCYILTH